MKKLKLVKQLDQYGCTVACLSMITDIPYFDMRDELHNRVDRLKHKYVAHTEIGLRPADFLDTLLDVFGISCAFIKFVSLKKLKRHCVLFVCPLEGSYGKIGYVHAVLFDAKQRCILDPDNDIKNLDRHNMTCCIELM